LLDILTAEEAGEQVGVSPITIRSWVAKGWLKPVNPGRRPMRFRWLEVSRCQADHRRAAERARLDTLRADYARFVGGKW
jgi:predicted site-specific integrase-resolvase